MNHAHDPHDPQGEPRDPREHGGSMGEQAGEQTGEQASEQAQAAGQAAGEQAEHIAGEAGESPDAEDVRERVRRLVVDTLRTRNLSLEELNEVSRQVLEGAAAGVKEATPEAQRTVLRSVIDGLADSYATAANAARLTLEEANARRKAFAEEDLSQAVRELRDLDKRFVHTVLRTTERAWGALREQAGAVKEHTQRAGESIRPSIEQALQVARRHPGRLATEAAAAGVEASRHTAGRLLQAMAGLLQGAGEAMAPSERAARNEPEREAERRAESAESNEQAKGKPEGESGSTDPQRSG